MIESTAAAQTPPAGTGAPLTAAEQAVYIELLEFMKSQLPEVAGYVESKAVHIVEEFKQLSSQTLEQSRNMEKVVEVARSIDLDGQTIPYEQSVQILYEPLAEAITKILQVSKLAMSMVMTIGNAADNISKVEHCIGEVQKLTRQTNMLAMNTQIEAARAGEAGRSFRIIAQEVKALSENIKSLSNMMQSEVSQVSGSVKKSSEVVDDLAYYDMTENLELKDKIDSLIDSIIEQNKRFSMVLKDSADSAQATARAIGNLVVGIQFQDRTTQVLGDFQSMLDKMIEHLRQAQPADAEDSVAREACIRRMIAEIRLSDIRNQALEHLRRKGKLDESSPIYQQYLAQQQAAPSSRGQDDDGDDDIELF